MPRRPLFALALMLTLMLTLWSVSQNPRREGMDEAAGTRSAALNAQRDALIVGASAQVLAGAEQYDLVCAACHGDTGLGYQEGVRSFPSSHQNCQRCHRPSNPDRIANMTVGEFNSFHIGEPPALRGDATLGTFANGSVLHAYIHAAMPRHAPGSLEDGVYLDVTVFLLALRGEVAPEATLTLEQLAEVGLHDRP